MQEVAEFLGISYSYFSKLYKEETGQSFRDYQIKRKMDIARDLLQNRNFKIREVSSLLGYSYPKHFARAFKKHFGYTPSEI
ncbi:MAG: helix-turn-helix transcriptional regulator [Spirochaetales bacterium]|nr:helix-turn-helix transcriptional regulator [Spirochaetales bacterium]